MSVVNAINGLGSAYTKSINGLAAASIKAINGAILSDVLLRFPDATFTRSGSPAYMLDTLNKRVLEFGADELAVTTYNDGDGLRTYAQIEEARENLTTYSQQHDHANWLRVMLTSVSGNAGTDPLGSATADMMIPNSVSGGHYLFQEPTFDGS